MFLVYLNILTQSISITDSMFNLAKFWTKNAITFDLTEIERKKKISRRHQILWRIQCCPQKCQNCKEKIFFFAEDNFCPKITDFQKN